ncbi:MAG TPA: APC family permease [Pseudolysinimonas sp.]|nr:APC family permease [Pseudolysinimonas sp.]
MTNPSTPRTSGAPITASIVAPGGRRVLGSWKIAGILLAFISPLGFATGTVPLALLFGGPTMPLMMIVAAIIVWLFLVGYVQMVQRIDRPGGFFVYITRGLGKPVGVGASYIAIAGYTLGAISIFAIQSFVSSAALGALGINIDSRICLLVIFVIVGVMSWRRIDFGARILGVIVVIESSLLIAFIISALINHGAAGAFDLGVFTPEAFKYGSWGVAFILAMLSFQGLEGGAMYAPEAKDPARSIPRGLRLALIIQTILFSLTVWVLISLIGFDKIVSSLSTNPDPASYVFSAVGDNLGTPGLTLFTAAAILALLGSLVATVTFLTRYFQGVAIDGLLPSVVGKLNKHGAPGVAVLFLIGIAAIVGFGAPLVGLNLFTQVAPLGLGLGVLSWTLILLLSSVSVIRYFRTVEDSARHWWRTLVAPLISSVLLIAVIVIAVSNFSYIVGSSEAWLNVLPLIMVLLLVAGILFALWLRSNRPLVYEGIASGDSAEEAEELRAERASRTTTV